MDRNMKAWLGGFLDGFSGGSLFTRARTPGAATQVFADEGSQDYPQRELVEEIKRREAEGRKP
jgi:hypothetical protein